MENTALLEPKVYTARQLPKKSPPVSVNIAGQAADALPGMSVAAHDDTDELPRADSAIRREARRRRRSVPVLQILIAIAGAAAGVYFAMSLPAGADYSGSLLCRSGDFAGLLIYRLIWGGAFLLAEYICGYFALGWLLVWAAPLVCGLGTGAALAGAFAAGTNAAPLIIPAVGAVIAVALGAGTSQMMSGQLLRLISAPRSTIISDAPAAGEYTLRFLIWFGILSGCAIVECALRAFL